MNIAEQTFGTIGRKNYMQRESGSRDLPKTQGELIAILLSAHELYNFLGFRAYPHRD
jgi:hypothetical protein